MDSAAAAPYIISTGQSREQSAGVKRWAVVVLLLNNFALGLLESIFFSFFLLFEISFWIFIFTFSLFTFHFFIFIFIFYSFVDRVNEFRECSFHFFFSFSSSI